MAFSKGKKRSPYAEKTICTRLTHGDDRELRSIAESEETDEAKMARKLISEALFARRMKRDQKDATTTVIYEAQRKAMADSLDLVTTELKEMRGELQTLNDTVVKARDEHTETLNYLRRAATRLVMDVVGFHLLLRNYVHTFLSIFVSRAGVKKDAAVINSEYSANYKMFMEEGRAEAERLADGDAESLLQKGGQIVYKTEINGAM